MTDQPKVSLVMPAYNAEVFVERAINSVLNQTYRNIELLIADDASKDRTKEIVESFDDPRVKFYHNNENLGYLKTCNKLMKLATGAFIGFQDADDYSSLDRIEVQMQCFKDDKELACCGTNMTVFDESGHELYCSNFIPDQQTIMNEMLKGNFLIMPNSFVFKREILDTVGYYHEYFNRIGAEDFYWAWLIMEKYKLINIKPALYYYTLNPNSVTGDWSDMPMKIHTKDILLFLLKQRKEKGYDSLEKDLTELNSFVERIDEPYRKDPSLFNRQLAERYFHQGQKKRAINLMMKAIKQNPLKGYNYKVLLYYLRNS